MVWVRPAPIVDRKRLPCGSRLLEKTHLQLNFSVQQGKFVSVGLFLIRLFAQEDNALAYQDQLEESHHKRDKVSNRFVLRDNKQSTEVTQQLDEKAEKAYKIG